MAFLLVLFLNRPFYYSSVSHFTIAGYQQLQLAFNHTLYTKRPSCRVVAQSPRLNNQTNKTPSLLHVTTSHHSTHQLIPKRPTHILQRLLHLSKCSSRPSPSPPSPAWPLPPLPACPPWPPRSRPAQPPAWTRALPPPTAAPRTTRASATTRPPSRPTPARAW